MEIEAIIKEILDKQGKPHSLPGGRYIPVNIRLRNGNILLKEFKILGFKKNVLIGLTRQEEYSAPREFRDPVYCSFKLDEIASVEWFGMEVAELNQDYTIGKVDK